jgi:hypothetical protein
MRIRVEPSAMAASKSSDMPMERMGVSCTRSLTVSNLQCVTENSDCYDEAQR